MRYFTKTEEVLAYQMQKPESEVLLVQSWPDWLQDAWRRPDYAVHSLWLDENDGSLRLGIHFDADSSMHGRVNWGDWLVCTKERYILSYSNEQFEAMYDRKA